ncbi:hypothetical protein E8E12_009956 [Didymella heteroderae]|uniref:Uncharacterized protein n=1 Tax=Didymella heteroderae TaxID=1769908 RepID=A0A9P4WX89_9PLEO|nr:hypothetical protein E8E12_009956 [Didymella heteroderae]
MATISLLPTRIQKLTSEIKEKEQGLAKLRKTEHKTFKAYIRARKKLSCKTRHDLQNPKVKKWYKIWMKSTDDLQALSTQLEREESELVSLKQQRAERIAADRSTFEAGLLRH